MKNLVRMKKWLCYMMEVAITKGNIEQLKCLFYASESNAWYWHWLEPTKGWDHKPDPSDQEASKRVENYLTLRKHVTSYRRYKTDEKSIEEAKTLIARMNRNDAEHLLNCYMHEKSLGSHEEKEIAELLLKHLKTSTNDQGCP